MYDSSHPHFFAHHPPPPPPPQPPTVEEEEDLEDQKDGAQVRMMLWLEIEKEKSNFAEEVKLIGGEFAVYAETVSDCLMMIVRKKHGEYIYKSPKCPEWI